MPPRDTSPEIHAAQREAWRRMSPAERLAITVDMSEGLRKLTRARIRLEHPDWSDWQVQIEQWRLAFLPQPLPPWVK